AQVALRQQLADARVDAGERRGEELDAGARLEGGDRRGRRVAPLLGGRGERDEDDAAAGADVLDRAVESPAPERQAALQVERVELGAAAQCTRFIAASARRAFGSVIVHAVSSDGTFTSEIATCGPGSRSRTPSRSSGSGCPRTARSKRSPTPNRKALSPTSREATRSSVSPPVDGGAVSGCASTARSSGIDVRS